MGYSSSREIGALGYIECSILDGSKEVFKRVVDIAIRTGTLFESLT